MNTLSNTEAVEIFEDYLFCLCEDGQTCHYCEARDLAIKALKDNDRDCESCSEISMLGRENEQLKKELGETKEQFSGLLACHDRWYEETERLQAKLDNQDPQLLDDALKEIARLNEKIDNLPSEEELENILDVWIDQLNFGGHDIVPKLRHYNVLTKAIHKRIHGGE